MKAAVLEALYQKRISFDTFALQTSTDWTRIANHLWNKWHKRIPSAITVDDIRQELLMNAWVCLGKYQPDKTNLRAYVLFMACSKTLRWIHDQRNALRRNGSSESRFPVAFSKIVSDSLPEELLCKNAVFEMDFESAVDARRTVSKGVATALTEAGGIDGWCLVAFEQAGYDFAKAGELVFEEPLVRRYGRWSKPEDATEQVQTSVCAWLAEQVAA